MIQGIPAYLNRLKRVESKLEGSISLVLYNLAKTLVKRAQESGDLPHDTGVDTTAQDNSYVCAVYHDGKLVQGPYVPDGTHDVGTDMYGMSYPDRGAEGKRWAMEWGRRGFLASGQCRNRGYEVMIANCAWYTYVLEEKGTSRHGYWHVINQLYDIFDRRTFENACEILKKSAGLDLSKCQYYTHMI